MHRTERTITIGGYTANLCICGDICVSEHGGAFTIYTDGLCYGPHTKPMGECPNTIHELLTDKPKRVVDYVTPSRVATDFDRAMSIIEGSG